MCGAGNRIAIYVDTSFGNPTSYTSSSVVATPTVPPIAGWVSSVGDYQNPNCYPDSTTSRVLRADTFTDAAMTVETCVAFAKQGLWRYAGVEYGV